MSLRCWLFGHDFLRAREPHRVYLRCNHCGHETVGLRDDYEDIQKPRVRTPPPPALVFVKPRRKKSA